MEQLATAEQVAEQGIILDSVGVFEHIDEYSCVQYRQLQDKAGVDIPAFGVYTKAVEAAEEDYAFQTIVSKQYDFTGNADVVNSIRDNIAEIGQTINQEIHMMDFKKCRFYNEIIIRNATAVQRVGDVYPMIVVENSYDGTHARKVSFGIAMCDHAGKWISTSLRELLGKFVQIHRVNHLTQMSTAIGNYVDAISGNIVDIISANFQNEVTETSLLSCMDLVEKSGGKKRRTDISAIIADITNEGTTPINSWDLFLALSTFSSMQKNLNGKLLMENIAERVLVMPVQIAETLQALRN